MIFNLLYYDNVRYCPVMLQKVFAFDTILNYPVNY